MIYIMLVVLILNILLLCDELIFGRKLKKRQFHERVRKEKQKQAKSNKKIKGKYKVEYMKYSLLISVAIFLSVFLLLKNFWIAVTISLLGFYYPRYRMKKSAKERKIVLNYQFREFLYAISNSLKAGASLQSAIRRSHEDLKQIYKHTIDVPLLDEIELIIYDMGIGKSTEEALEHFRDRVQLEDVTSFVNAAVITNRTGGNLTEVMHNVAMIIGDKIEIKREITTLTASKRSEAKILTFMPVGLVIILNLIAPQYMKPMYETTLGKVCMAFGMMLITANYFIGKRIINIDI